MGDFRLPLAQRHNIGVLSSLQVDHQSIMSGSEILIRYGRADLIVVPNYLVHSSRVSRRETVPNATDVLLHVLIEGDQPGVAASFGVTVSPHWFHDLHVHLVGSVPNCGFVEFFPDDQVLNFRRLVDRQLEVEAGELVLPGEPGLGFDFDSEAVEAYTLPGAGAVVRA